MIPPHELAYKFALPAVRALVSRQLIRRHGLTQEQVAQKLGITQAAVSNYMRSKRARLLDIHRDREVKQATKEMANFLAAGQADEIQLTTKLTRLCNYVLQARLLCALHCKLEPHLDAADCHACDAPLLEIKMSS